MSQKVIWFAEGIVLLQLVIMSMGLFLYIKSKSRRYLWLASSFAIALIGMFLFLIFGINEFLPKAWLIFSSFNTFAYILIHMAYFQLFDRKDERTLRLLGIIGITALIFIVAAIFLPQVTSNIIINLIWISLSVCFLYIIAFRFRRSMYTFSLYLGISAALFMGLKNFFTHGPTIAMLILLVQYFMLFLVLFECIVEMIQNVSYSSALDGLTGLFNRKFFNQQAAKHIQNGTLQAVIFLDIDNFKKLNDTKGHDVGDQMLRFVADILKYEVEEIGLAGRYGGEETVVMITDDSIDPAVVAENIRFRIEEESKAITPISVSVGYAHFSEGLTSSQLVKLADEAMYLAKTTGKNKVCSYNFFLEMEQQKKNARDTDAMN